MGAAFTTGLQVAVLVATWIISRLHTRPILEASFPWIGAVMMTAGTLLLTCCLAICVWIVDVRTQERCFASELSPSTAVDSKAHQFPHRSMNLWWVQTTKPDTSTTLKPNLLLSKDRQTINISQRREPLESDLASAPKVPLFRRLTRRIMLKEEIIVVLAVVLGLLSFGAQFQGIRLSNFLCGLAQVIAMLIATAVRAFVRRRLVKQPQPAEVPSGHELDHLAMCIVGGRGGDNDFTNNLDSNLARFSFGIGSVSSMSACKTRDSDGTEEKSVNTNEVLDEMTDAYDELQLCTDERNCNDTQLEIETRNIAQETVDMRTRLGAITGLMNGPKVQEAAILAESIEAAVKALELDFSTLGDQIQFEIEVTTALNNPYWNKSSELLQKDNLQGKPENIESIRITLIQVPNANGGREWKADTAELEAILSLAEYSRYLAEQQWKKRPGTENDLRQNSEDIGMKAPADTKELTEYRDWQRKKSDDVIRYNRVLIAPPGEMNGLIVDLIWWGRDLHSRFEVLGDTKPTTTLGENGRVASRCNLGLCSSTTGKPRPWKHAACTDILEMARSLQIIRALRSQTAMSYTFWHFICFPPSSGRSEIYQQWG